MDKQEEEKRHGNAIFPCSVYAYDAPIENKEKIYCHWHKEVELLYVVSGRCTLRINHRLYEIQKGDFIFIPANQVHMAVGDQVHAFQFIAVVFHPDLIASFGNDVVQQNVIEPMVHWKFNVSPVFHQDSLLSDSLYKILQTWQTREQGYELHIKTQLFVIFDHIYELISKYGNMESNPVDYKVTEIKEIISYIQKNYKNDISLLTIASSFSMSKGHFCRFFKEMTGMTFIEYVNYYRINESCELLKKTDFPIRIVAEMTGYRNVSYFNRTFQKYIHMNPQEYRKQL